jgi:hypothetical protein
MTKLLSLILILAAPTFADRASDAGIDPATTVRNLTDAQLVRLVLGITSTDSLVVFHANQGGSGTIAEAVDDVLATAVSRFNQMAAKYHEKYGKDAIVAARMRAAEAKSAADILLLAGEYTLRQALEDSVITLKARIVALSDTTQ